MLSGYGVQRVGLVDIAWSDIRGVVSIDAVDSDVISRTQRGGHGTQPRVSDDMHIREGVDVDISLVTINR